MYYLKIILIRLDRSKMTIEATRAVVKESIWKPLMNWAAIIRRMALITKIKSPRVTIVAGRVKKIRIGLTDIFKIPKTKATAKAVI